MNLLRALDMTVPIVQAPMAGVQGSALAVAVANAGGLGSLPCALLDADAIRNEVQVIRAGTARSFNLNFFCHAEPVPDAGRDRAWHARLAPYYAEYGLAADTVRDAPRRRPFGESMAELVEEVRPPVVSFHFGLPPAGLLDRVRRSGARILSSATTVEEALWLESHGVDGVIAQGFEAGGHRAMFLTEDVSTQVGTLALVPQVVEAVRVPVIAAGGIADARGVAAALALGAAAVQVGTAYLLCPECTTTPLHRAALQSRASLTTAITNVFTGRPARAIVNRLVAELGPMNDGVPPFPLAAGALAPLRARAEQMGNGDFSSLWASQHARGCRAIPAAEMTKSLVSGL